MPGNLLNAGATVQCSHAGTAQPVTPNTRVMAGGEATATLATAYTVAGCTMPPPPNGNGPCVTATFTTGAARVTSNAQPVLLSDSQAICAPTGTPLVIAVTQLKARGT